MNAKEQYEAYIQRRNKIIDETALIEASYVSDERFQFASHILAGQKSKIQQWGDKAFSLSEKQIAVIERAFAEQEEYNATVRTRYDQRIAETSVVSASTANEERKNGMSIDVEWLKGKSEAEQRVLLDPDPQQAWYTYPSVNSQEAEALRNGKPYPLSHFDIERLNYIFDMGFNGDPDTDPLVIKCLAKGYIAVNPKWQAYEDFCAAEIAKLIKQYGPGHYSIGVGNGYGRWALTEAGKEFIRGFNA